MELDDAAVSWIALCEVVDDVLCDPRLARAWWPRKYDLWTAARDRFDELLQASLRPVRLTGEPLERVPAYRHASARRASDRRRSVESEELSDSWDVRCDAPRLRFIDREQVPLLDATVLIEGARRR